MSNAWGPVMRAGRRVAPALALAVVFVLASAVGFVLHLGTAPGRRLVAKFTNSLVSALLVSELRIERIDVLSPSRLVVSRAELVDRLGKPVLVAEGLEARFGLVELLFGILGDGEVRVAVSDVRVERFRLALTRDASNGELTLERAFELAPSGPPNPNAKPVFVALPRIAVVTASVTTNLEGLETTSARVDALAAGLDLSPAGLVLSLKSDGTTITRLFRRDVTGRLVSELRFPGTTRATLDARVGRAPVNAELGWRGKELNLGLRSVALEPDAMHELFGAWPLRVPLRASVRAAGEPAAMKASTSGELGACRFSGAGSLALTPDISSELALRAEGLDLRAFDAGAPETALDVDATVAIRFRRELEIETTVNVGESSVAGYVLPALKVHGTYAQGAFAGTATALDPKLTTSADFRVSQDGRVEFATKSPDVELAALARYGVPAKGRAAVSTRGVLEGGQLRATFEVSLRDARVGDVRAKRADIRGSVNGPVKNPRELAVDVTADGDALVAGGVTLPRFHATSRGTGARQSVSVADSSEEHPTFEASADVSLGERVVLDDVALHSRRGNAEVRVAVARIEASKSGVSLEGIALRTGEGTMGGSISARGRRRVVDLTLTDVDLGRLVAALGVSTSGIRGRVDGRVHFDEVGSERTGDAELSLRDGAFPPVADVGAKLTANFAGTGIDADAAVSVAGLGSGKLDAEVKLERSILDPRALLALVGRVNLEFSELELAATAPWLSETGIALRGKAGGSVSVSRASASDAGVASYRVKTEGLVVSRDAGDGQPPVEIRLDVSSTGELLGPKGSRVALELADAQGPWIAAVIEHSLGPHDFANARAAGVGRAILDAPLSVALEAYGRPLHVFGYRATGGIERTVSAHAAITGSARLPEIDASAKVTGLGATAAERDAGRIDVTLRYSASRERYELTARTPSERDHLELASAGRFAWFERGLGSDWSAKGEAALTRFELAPLGSLADVPLTGEASGRGRFDIENGRIEVSGELDVKELNVDRLALGNGSGRFDLDDGRAEAKLVVESKRSRVELVGDAGVAWATSGLELDPKKGGTVRATAREFDLATLRPLLRDVLTRVSGKLNGHVELGWGPQGVSGQRATTLRANAIVSDGAASLAAGGGLIQKLELQALGDGDGPLRLAFSGAARARKPNVQGTAKLSLEGPRLKRFDAELALDTFPLVYEGVLMGRVTSGTRAPLEVSIVSEKDGQTVSVHVPSVEVTLPKGGDQSLIALDDDGSIAISDAPVDPEVVRRAAAPPSNTTLKVRLGRQVRIRRGGLDVPVTGAIVVLPGGTLDGSITFPAGGVVPALGQIFRIRRGTVRFKKQPANRGTLAIQAWTRAADGTLIDLDVSGTVSEPVIAFRSDPPRSEDEIVALLLGVQTDTGTSDESQQLGRTAMALAMNKLVEDSMLSGLQFGAGETDTGDSVSTVTMRVGSKVWVEGRTVRGSQTSVNQEERVSGVVDWRFAPSWSLRTQLGDVSGVEIRWSLRY